MEKMKLIAGILVFGSLWGFSENLIGSLLRDNNLPAGALMTSIFAMSFLVLSRLWYKQRGMQLGMGLVAGALRIANPFGGCFLCSAIAIMAEGLLFELIWYKLSFDLHELDTQTVRASMGIISVYTLYVGGYIVTQTLTPLVAGATFYVENLVFLLPYILSGGLLAALLGAIIVPVVIAATQLQLTIKDERLYYPATLSISLICWLIVIAHTLILLAS